MFLGAPLSLISPLVTGNIPEISNYWVKGQTEPTATRGIHEFQLKMILVICQ